MATIAEAKIIEVFINFEDRRTPFCPNLPVKNTFSYIPDLNQALK